MRYGIDLTACWRRRVGMVTSSLELARGLVRSNGAEFVLLCSRERPSGFGGAARVVLSPHRHEVANKLAWLPFVEAEAGLHAILYPYWPSPPWRRPGAPPAAIVVHDLAFRVRPREVPWQQRLYLGSLLPPALRAAAAVLVPSRATREDLLEHYPVAGLESRLRVVPEAPSPLGGEEAALPDGLEPGFILAVGTVEHRKNYPRLLSAYRMLRERRAQTPQLVVAGRAGWAVDDTLRRLGREPGVVHLGHVSDQLLLTLYRHAALLAFPSLYEGFGLPLLDAMREGLPSLIGDRGALPELAAGSALAVDPEAVEAIAAGLGRLLDDAPLRRRLVEAGRLRASAYTWEASARATREVLAEIASERIEREP